jgi:prepilin-type N-terminal cleavage/methylation domain-containing protein
MNKNKKGFTLIELLIVVGLISILSGVILGVVNVGGLRSKTRDAQRKADLKKIQTALELYFADFRAYPASAGYILAHNIANLSPGYISIVPRDPLYPGTAFGGCGTNYGYSYRAITSAYVIIVNMEVATSATDSPCTSLPNWGAAWVGGANPCASCYGVQNPL